MINKCYNSDALARHLDMLDASNLEREIETWAQDELLYSDSNDVHQALSRCANEWAELMELNINDEQIADKFQALKERLMRELIESCKSA